MGEFRVVICGGGVAAIEGLLRLRRLAGERVRITMVAPNDEFVYRPLAVAEAVAFGRARRHGLTAPVNEKARQLVWAVARGEQRSSRELLRHLYEATRGGPQSA